MIHWNMTMNDRKELLEQAINASEQDIRAKYVVSLKMLYALIDSVGECCPPRVEQHVYNMFSSLVHFDKD